MWREFEFENSVGADIDWIVFGPVEQRQGSDLGDALVGAIMAMQARAKSEQVKCAQRMIQERGALTGRASFGYTAVGEKYGKTLEPTDLGRATAPRIFAEVIAGEPLATIALWLDAEGLTAPGGGTWSAKSVGRLIKNPTYIGRRCNASGETILRCEPLVPADVFRQANEV